MSDQPIVRCCRGRRAQRGQVLAMFALLSTAFLGVVGLAVDGALSYGHERDAHNLADAASLAAASYLSKNVSQSPSQRQAGATSAATTVLARNSSANAANLTLVPVDISGNPTPAGSWGSDAFGVTATVRTSHGTFFMRVVGQATTTTSQNATAIYGYPSSIYGVVPIDINLDASQSPVGTTMCMAVAGGSGAPGCSVNAGTFQPPECAGSLDPDGCFATAVANGLTAPVSLNRPLNAGSVTAISAAAAAAIQARIAARPNETASNFTVGSPRVVAVIVLNGGIGGATVTPIAFQMVFLQSVQAAPQSTLTVTLVRAATVAAPGQPLQATAPSGVDSAITLKLIV
jgi:Flp pilus assembly protein TadG